MRGDDFVFINGKYVRLYGSIVHQVILIICAMAAFGQSKHKDKKKNKGKPARDKLYGSVTMTDYMHVCVAFVKWARGEHNCRTVAGAYIYVGEYLRKKIEGGYRPCTVHKVASALAKLYRVASADFGVKLPDRERKDVIRNKSADSRFDVLKYKDLYVFMLNTGLRRKELKLIQPEDVTMEEGKCMIHVRCGKGGKVRNFAALSAEPYRIAQEAMLAGAELIFPRIPKYCACHYYRKVFATSLYILHMEDLETLSREEKYYCAKELQGVVLAKKAMWIVSKALGHERLGVTTRYILFKPGDPECSEKAD